MTTEPNKKMKALDYDMIANGYDKRYETAYRPDGIESKLLDLVRTVRAQMVLEVGCGTGHWLGLLKNQTHVVGIDLSSGMLQKAAELKADLPLVRGDATCLPFCRLSFDAVFCVNALHHFRDPSAFLTEGRGLLRPNGVLAIIGMNPHAGQDRWFIYDYFPGTRETDLQRYPSPGAIADWMISVGFSQVSWQVAERIRDDKHGGNVLPLHKDFTSQLSLLTSTDYAEGVARIEATVRKARGKGQSIVFPVDISLSMVTGWIASEL